MSTSKSKLAGLSEKFTQAAESGQLPVTRAPVRAGPIELLHERGTIAKLESRITELEKAQGGAVELPLHLIDDSPYQDRHISEESVRELAENLRHNPLTSPIVVRRKGDRFECIAGHRRRRAFELLGRNAIPAVVVEHDDSAALRSLVFDNLIAPSLPDYERYLGLARIRKQEGWTQEQLARQSGLDQSLVSRLLAFERLPVPIHRILSSHPAVLGAIHASQLVTLVESGAPEHAVIEAVERIARGEMNATQALAELRPNKPIKRPAPTTVIKSGRHKYAEVLRRGDVIRISLADKGLQDAEQLEQAIAELLKRHASK